MTLSRSEKIKVITFPPSLWPLLALLALLVSAAATLAFSPSARLASLYYGSPLKGVTVAIDPGHGGIDSGAHFESLMLEKDIVLEIGLELRRLLQQAGARVMITREKDENLAYHFPDDSLPLHRRDVRGRVKLINASAATLAISLHINSIYDSSVRGRSPSTPGAIRKISAWLKRSREILIRFLQPTPRRASWCTSRRRKATLFTFSTKSICLPCCWRRLS